MTNSAQPPAAGWLFPLQEQEPLNGDFASECDFPSECAPGDDSDYDDEGLFTL